LHKTGTRPVRDALLQDVNAVSLDADLHELAGIALSQEHDVPVTDTAGRLAGVVSCRTILKQVMERRAA
jgi:glycine betaine/proline transport system ATP-binding protein